MSHRKPLRRSALVAGRIAGAWIVADGHRIHADGDHERVASTAAGRTFAVRTSPALATPDDPGPEHSWTTVAPPTVSATATIGPDDLIVPDELMVLVTGTDAVAAVEALGGTVLDSAMSGQLHRVRIPQDTTLDDFSAQLATDSRVERASELGVIRGAVSDRRALQWHREVVGGNDIARGWNDSVAVVDSGMAWGRERCRELLDRRGIHRSEHPWPATLPSVGGYYADNGRAVGFEFVEDNNCGLDRHNHGSHIASTIGSRGWGVHGVERRLNPVSYRVLDEHDQGSEWSLIQALEAIIEHNEDPTTFPTIYASTNQRRRISPPRVVNMSLAFAPGYVPSPELQATIDRVFEAGIVMVAAAGNDGVDEVSRPAAHPRVVAVGSVCPSKRGDFELAPYSNVGAELDILAPGGCLDRDNNQDGPPDGILASTVVRGALPAGATG